MRRRLGPKRTVTWVAATAILALAGCTATASAPVPKPIRTELRVTGRELGRPIPSGFLGLSIEFSSLYAYAGTEPHRPNPVFVRLIDGLVPGQQPLLRIGGDSTDRTWWPLPHTATPPWARYTLTSKWTAVARGLAMAASARLLLGINLLADSREIAAAEGNAFVRGIGRGLISGFEIGNEPELYSTQPWYFTREGKPVPGRPPGYTFGAYLRELSRIRSALPPMAQAGPATGTLSWLSHLGGLFAAKPGLAQATFHRYPLNRCVHDPRSPMYPTVAHLLSPASSSGLTQGMAPYVALAHRRGAQFRIDELNTVTCSGQAGVSDTFASALWALDTQFSLARAGVDGVDVHIHPEAPANQLFSFRRGAGAVRPQYYGLWMFSRAAPPGARLLQITGRLPGQLRAWATRAVDGKTRIVLINDSLTSAATIVVRLAGQDAPAVLERLEAPSAYATGGVTLGGQSFGPAGMLQRPLQATTVRPAKGGGYLVRLAAASAAMLTI